MTTERFIIFLLLGALVWVYFFGVPDLPDPQRSSQPLVRATAAYSIDTSQPATVIFNTPEWQTQVVTATPYPTATSTAVPSVPGLTLTSDATPEPQRGEQGNERGCASYRSCDN